MRPSFWVHSLSRHGAKLNSYYEAKEVDAWLDQHFKDAVEISGRFDSIGKPYAWGYQRPCDTHKALLVGITPLKCEHEISGYNVKTFVGMCAKCGIKLKAKWEPA